MFKICSLLCKNLPVRVNRGKQTPQMWEKKLTANKANAFFLGKYFKVLYNKARETIFFQQSFLWLKNTTESCLYNYIAYTMSS